MKAFRKMLVLVRPYWGRMVIACICSFAVAGASGLLAWLVKPAVDKVFVERQAASLLMLSLAVMGTYLIRGIFSFAHSYLMRSAGAKVMRDIRNRLYHHLLYLPMSFIHRDSTGATVSRVINDAGLIHGLLAYTIKDIIVEAGTVVILISIALYLRLDLTLISIIVLPVAFYFVSKLGKRLKKVSDRTQEKISLLTEILAETFSGSKVIKSFNQEEAEYEMFKDKNQDYYRELMRSTRIIEATSLMMEFVGGFGIAFVLWYGGSLVIEGAMTAGDFFSFLTAIFMVYTPARRLAGASNSLQQARAPLERIDLFLDEQRETEGKGVLGGFREEIAFRNVSFRYPGTGEEALDRITVTIRKGEVVALIGRSGAGKTTLVDLIPRFHSPTDGDIRIDGIDIATLNLSSLRSVIGIVSQDVVLFNDTVRSNIAYGRPGATEEEILNAARAAYAHEFILQLPAGYATVVGERGVRLSGGQKQRLSIARALLKNPPILILDEATSSLDTASEIMVQKALENLMNDRTALVIAHRLSTVRRANRIIVLDKGKIAESGTHDELLAADGLYRKLYNLQFDYTAADQLLEPPSAFTDQHR